MWEGAIVKRLLIVLAGASLLAFVGLSHMATDQAQAAPAPKVLVCHIDEIEPIVDEDTGEVTGYAVVSAHVISVSGNAQTAHTDHGDVVVTSEDNLAKGDDCTTLEGLQPDLKAGAEADE